MFFCDLFLHELLLFGLGCSAPNNQDLVPFATVLALLMLDFT